jgi:hypothetical protein
VDHDVVVAVPRECPRRSTTGPRARRAPPIAARLGSRVRSLHRASLIASCCPWPADAPARRIAPASLGTRATRRTRRALPLHVERGFHGVNPAFEQRVRAAAFEVQAIQRLRQCQLLLLIAARDPAVLQFWIIFSASCSSHGT